MIYLLIQIHEIARMRPENPPSDQCQLNGILIKNNQYIYIWWQSIVTSAFPFCSKIHPSPAVCLSRVPACQEGINQHEASSHDLLFSFSSGRGGPSQRRTPISWKTQSIPCFHRWIDPRDNFQETMVQLVPESAGTKSTFPSTNSGIWAQKSSSWNLSSSSLALCSWPTQRLLLIGLL